MAKKKTKKVVDPFKNMGNGKGKRKSKSVVKKSVFNRFKAWLKELWKIAMNDDNCCGG